MFLVKLGLFKIQLVQSMANLSTFLQSLVELGELQINKCNDNCGKIERSFLKVVGSYFAEGFLVTLGLSFEKRCHILL